MPFRLVKNVCVALSSVVFAASCKTPETAIVNGIAPCVEQSCVPQEEISMRFTDARGTCEAGGTLRVPTQSGSVQGTCRGQGKCSVVCIPIAVCPHPRFDPNTGRLVDCGEQRVTSESPPSIETLRERCLSGDSNFCRRASY